jgi:transcriptional regulator
MYIPKFHEQSDLGTLHALMRSHPLATWATLGEDELIINHLPFQLDDSQGRYGLLRCHVARANSVWQLFSKTVPSIVVFHGPETYVSPSWYPSRQAHGRVLPTWNYTVVHAHGIPAIIEEPARLIEHLTQLTAGQERMQAVPWHLTEAPAGFIEQMARNIVGIEIPISRLFGKWKVSQNRMASDRDGVAAGLRSSNAEDSAAMAALVDEVHGDP